MKVENMGTHGRFAKSVEKIQQLCKQRMNTKLQVVNNLLSINPSKMKQLEPHVGTVEARDDDDDDHHSIVHLLSY